MPSLIGRLNHLDAAVSRRVAMDWPHPRWFAWPLSGISLSANYGVLWYVLALIPWVGGASSPLWRALYVAIPVTLVEMTGFAIKQAVGRVRPPVADTTQSRQIPIPLSKSFPSSHASMAMVGTLTLGGLYPAWLPALIALTFTLCFSRVYLGVHYLGDVLGGVAYGLLFGLAWIVLVSAPA